MVWAFVLKFVTEKESRYPSADKLQHEGPCENGLGLEGFQGPGVGHLTGDDTGDIRLYVHMDYGVFIRDVHGDEWWFC